VFGQLFVSGASFDANKRDRDEKSELCVLNQHTQMGFSCSERRVRITLGFEIDVDVPDEERIGSASVTKVGDSAVLPSEHSAWPVGTVCTHRPALGQVLVLLEA